MEEERKKLLHSLSEYETNMAEVATLLQQQPDNGELLELRKELRLAIQKTKEELEASTQKEGKEEKEILQLNVGEYCTAKYSKDGRFYTARVESIEENRYNVHFVGYGLGEEACEYVKKEHTRKYRNPDLDLLRNGDRCWAVWKEDGLWHEGTVETTSESGNFWVTFGRLGVEEVDIHHIRPTEESLENKKRQRKEAFVDEAGGKRRKKSTALLEKEAEGQKRQDAWKSFISKKGKGKTKSLKKTSMFKSPETLTGRVGVTGSDRRQQSLASAKTTGPLRRPHRS
eukprot:TRINITY_DN1029_c2_g1_i1.p1 TRINITY_DN1029_c2_g1~~TRINITY_DN1029_c2_g1_i1.p1  ORF type:complete len:304 (+),score=103.55 TRINITY_DN1029_c2_g1_i1:59-913(+)